MATRSRVEALCLRQPSNSLHRSLGWGLAVGLMAMLDSANAQLGSECACTPSTYEIELDFALSCDTNRLESNGGIENTDCTIAATTSADVTDLAPTVITTVDILELGPELQVIQTASLFGEFGDGAVFRYESISMDPMFLNETFYPKFLEVSMAGENAAGDGLFMIWLLTFTNDCEVFPVVSTANQSEVVDPVPGVCPAANSGTRSPTTPIPPTRAPVVVPTPRPTPRPTDRSGRPTDRPTRVPTHGGSTKSPVQKKTAEPTYEEYYGPYYGKGKGKGKGMGMSKSKKSSKKSSKKGGKGMMGKGKSRGSSKYDVIFGKGKGKGYYAPAPRPVPHPVPTPGTPPSPSQDGGPPSGDASGDALYDDDFYADPPLAPSEPINPLPQYEGILDTPEVPQGLTLGDLREIQGEFRNVGNSGSTGTLGGGASNSGTSSGAGATGGTGGDTLSGGRGLPPLPPSSPSGDWRDSIRGSSISDGIPEEKQRLLAGILTCAAALFGFSLIGVMAWRLYQRDRRAGASRPPDSIYERASLASSSSPWTIS